MITNSISYGGSALFNALLNVGGQSAATTQSTVYGICEYFVSTAQPAATSEINYFMMTEVEQIQTRINDWLDSFGSQTRIETNDGTLWVAPPVKIPQEHFDSYKPVFKTVSFYRSRVSNWNGEATDAPSEEQRNTALLGLANLILARMPVPSPMFLEDGTIGVYWRRGKCYASIDFEVDGEHSWAGTDGTKYLSGTWKVPGEPLPPALTNDLLPVTLFGRL